MYWIFSYSRQVQKEDLNIEEAVQMGNNAYQNIYTMKVYITPK